ncbi:MAG: tRNA pseudouridine(38-40) synthase TruA [Solirubrobacterales bacterium]
MPVTRLEIEYDGSGFRGWAAQPGMRTVQGELEAALETILGEPVSLSAAGRTDAGVHAAGQVASFESAAQSPRDLARSLNGVLSPDVSVSAAVPAPDGFDARRDARSRTYCYRLLARPAPSPFERGRSLWWPRPLDREALDGCASALRGTHDFTAFTPTETDHVRFERRILGSEWVPEHPPAGGSEDEGAGGVLCFWIEADAFMRNMVRALVGTMLEVGGGRRTGSDFARLLEGAPREQAGDTAPAHGLYLASVSYDGTD